MPLAYEVRQPLTIPDEAYKDDIATLVVTGTRYGGCWRLSALIGAEKSEVVGQIFTAPHDSPAMAVDTILVWVNDFCARSGLKLAHFEDKNGEYPPDQAPYFAAALVLIDRR